LGFAKETANCEAIEGAPMVTRNDVARAAGVSSAVVSYVMNGGPRRVSPATAQRVHEAIQELNYRPNGVARALATNRTWALALIVPDNANSYFAMLAQLIETAAFERGYTLLLGNTMEDTDREQRYVETFLQRGVDGLIVAPTSVPGPGIGDLARGSSPVVLIDRDGERDDLPRVTVENEEGGYLATRHLLDHGHRRIACLAGPESVSNARKRRDGWQRAMSEVGCDIAGLTVSTDFSRAHAYRSTLEILKRPEPPTAFFATADEQALGVYRAVREMGAHIPDDVAVVSFDSADTAPYLNPGLTAVSQPLELMATVAIERLIQQLGVAREVTRDVLPVKLVVRGSCGCREPATGSV
jgi:LacI family transcriptional regulator